MPTRQSSYVTARGIPTAALHSLIPTDEGVVPYVPPVQDLAPCPLYRAPAPATVRASLYETPPRVKDSFYGGPPHPGQQTDTC